MAEGGEKGGGSVCTVGEEPVQDAQCWFDFVWLATTFREHQVEFTEESTI